LAYFLSWAGTLFDLSIGFLFLFRRTRFLAMLLTLIFHGTNHFLIFFSDIDWSPLLGVLTALIFFEPGWPDTLLQLAKTATAFQAGLGLVLCRSDLLPVIGAALGWKLRTQESDASARQRWPAGRCRREERWTFYHQLSCC